MRARLHCLGLTALFAAIVAATPATAQRTDPLPRFEDPLCPGIVGLQLEAAERMVTRIRDHADELGIRLADAEGCEPNLIVAFLSNGQEYLQQLNASRGYLFEELSPQERSALLADEGPAHVLAQVRTRSRDGMVMSRRDGLVNPPQTEMWSAHSRIYTPTRRDIVSALVLIDSDEIGGINVDQLADYVVLRAFTADRPELLRAAGNSILTLFDAPEGERPAGLTASDRAILASLYSGPPNLRASSRLAELNRSDTINGAE